MDVIESEATRPVRIRKQVCLNMQKNDEVIGNE